MNQNFFRTQPEQIIARFTPDYPVERSRPPKYLASTVPGGWDVIAAATLTNTVQLIVKYDDKFPAVSVVAYGVPALLQILRGFTLDEGYSLQAVLQDPLHRVELANYGEHVMMTVYTTVGDYEGVDVADMAVCLSFVPDKKQVAQIITTIAEVLGDSITS